MKTTKIIIPVLIAGVAIVLGLAAVLSKQRSPSLGSGITFEEDKKILPFPPNTLEVIQTADGMQVTWPALISDRIGEYRVYGRTTKTNDWQLLATIPVKPSVTGYSYLDKFSSSSEYAVASVTIYGTEGPKGPIATPKP